MKASHNLAAVAVTFDEDNVVPDAGLIAPATLAQRLGIAVLVQQRVRLAKDRPGAANSGWFGQSDLPADIFAPAQPIIQDVFSPGQRCWRQPRRVKGCSADDVKTPRHR